MEYPLDNAVAQWEEGERRVSEVSSLEPAVSAVLAELRRRLGSPFEIAELADLYGEDPDWAADVARSKSAGSDVVEVVDAAFHRHARAAADYGGGRVRRRVEGEGPAED